jgi:hypothetical protein
MPRELANYYDSMRDGEDAELAVLCQVCAGKDPERFQHASDIDETIIDMMLCEFCTVAHGETDEELDEERDRIARWFAGPDSPSSPLWEELLKDDE